MIPTSVILDKTTHGGIITMGSPSRLVNGLPVARVGDKVICPQHGPTIIISAWGGMPLTDYMPTAHAYGKTSCGAFLLPSLANNPSPSGVSGVAGAATGASLALMEADDMFESGGIGATGSSFDKYRERAIMGMGFDGESEPSNADGAPVTKATPVACQDIPENTASSFKLSTHFTLNDLSGGAACARAAGAASGPVVPNKGLSRAEIICNLRHLAKNSLDPIAAKFGRRSMIITSGFRRGGGESDHNIGSAVDIQFLVNGKKADGRELDRIQKTIINELKIPFTQIIHENNSWLHIACRRNGQNSAKRICWWAGGPYNVGYRYT